MAQSRRLPETWFRRGLWLIAVLFAAFLIGLGGLVVDKLPGVAPAPTLDSFIDPAQATRADAAVKQAETQAEDIQSQLETARLQLKARSTAYRNARESFNDWVATRTATAQASQDAELVSRARSTRSRPPSAMRRRKSTRWRRSNSTPHARCSRPVRHVLHSTRQPANSWPRFSARRT